MNLHSIRSLALLVPVIFFGIALPVLAAPLSYSADTFFTLTTPATTLTVSAGSVADVISVNDDSVVVTMSAGTGGSFVISSASNDLSASGGTASKTCSSGVATLTLTAPATYTITAGNSVCVPAPSGGGSSGGGSVGVSGGVIAFPNLAPATIGSSTSISPSATSSTSVIASSTTESSASSSSVSLSAQATLLAQLQAQLQILLKQAGEHGIAAISPGGGSGTSGLGGGFVFLKNLSFPVRDPDVLHVQQFLNGHGFVISPSGPGSPGHETIVFGYATLYQLKRYQASVGIPATGYFGFQTRAFMNTRLR